MSLYTWLNRVRDAGRIIMSMNLGLKAICSFSGLLVAWGFLWNFEVWYLGTFQEKLFHITYLSFVSFKMSCYMGSLNKKASGAQCFIMALGLFWDIVTGLPWTPNGFGSLEPRGYCIFLPGAHYLTINSPYGADSSLNKLLLLLLLQDVLTLVFPWRWMVARDEK